MALSGSNYKSFARHRLVAEWTATQNVAKNQSTVTVKVFLQSVDAYGAMNAPASNAGSVKVGTTTKNFTATSHLSAKQKKQLTSQSFVVNHKADGTGSFSYSVTFNINVTFSGVFYGNQTVSGTGTLNTIPRASSIESINGNQIGGNITVNIKRASSNFTHRVGYYDTDGQRRSEIQDATTSTTFAIPLDRCNLLPNSTSGVAKIVVDTYNGSTKIGSVSKSHTVYVPSSVVPVVNSFNIKEGITKVANVKLPANNFVQNMSRLDMTAGASGKYNSTIKDYTFSFNGQSQGGTVGRQFNAGNINGTYDAKVEVTDSRGRKASKTVSVTIHKYSNPSINNFKIYRVGQTTQVKADINFAITNINSLGGSWSIQKLVGTTWTNTNTGTLTTTHSATGLVVVGTYDVTKSQNFRVVLSDAFGTGATANGSISTAKTLLDFDKDIGIGIGKMREKGVLDIGGEVFIKGPSNMQPSTANTADNAQNILVNFRRPNGTLHSGFDIGGASDALRIHQYDTSGTWLSMHYFNTNGNVRFAKNVDASGKIASLGPIETDQHIWAKTTISSEGAMYESGRRVHADWTPPELWSGATYMTGTQTITPSKSLANCRNGWMLAWSDYTNGVANNYDWVFTPIPKTAISAGVNGMHAIVANSNAANAPMLSKYIYVGTGTSIVGQNNNNVAGLDNIVLRKVYEW